MGTLNDGQDQMPLSEKAVEHACPKKFGKENTTSLQSNLDSKKTDEKRKPRQRLRHSGNLQIRAKLRNG